MAWRSQQEAAAKVLRLRKLQRQLDERKKDLIKSGLNSIAELEEKERKEAEERREREAVVEELLAQPTPPIDPGFDFFAFDPFLNPYSAAWPPVDASGGTSQASRGS
jgi:hypothetical protein